MVDPYSPWLVWAFPMVGAALTPLLATIGKRVRDYAAVGFSLAAALTAALMIPYALEGGSVDLQVDWIPSLGIRAGVIADPLSVIMANVVAWIGFLIMVYSLGYMHGDPGLTRYWFLMNFFIGNMLLLVMSDNLLQMLFGWEGVGLCSYALIGYWYKDEEERWVGEPRHESLGVPMAYPPSHAGMKAFIFTRVGDIALLISIFIIYSYAGTFNISELSRDLSWAAELARAGLLVPAAVLFFGGPVGKSAQFPLHEWLPDAMAGPTSVSALIHAATMVKAGVFLVARGGPIFFAALREAPELTLFFEAIAWIGALTAFVAATQALVSREIKKVLAYSTVSQIGYMMLALGAGGFLAEFAAGVTAGMFHLMSHAIFKAALFLAAGALIHSCGTRFMDEMGGISREVRYTFVSMTVAALSLSGVPPLMGFWSKDAVLKTVLEAGQLPLFGLAAITVAVTALYSLRMLGITFLGGKSRHLHEIEAKGVHVHEAPMVMLVPYAILAAATLILGALGPLVESSLHKLLVHNEVVGGRVKATIPQLVLGLEPGTFALTASLGMLLIGGSVGYFAYIGRKFDPSRLVAGNAVLRATREFFRNRWYINQLYYRVFVSGTYKFSHALWRWAETAIFDRINQFAPLATLSFCRGLFRSVEVAVIDRFNYRFADVAVRVSALGDRIDLHVIDGVINGIAAAGKFGSNVIRRVQTGVTQQYVLVFIGGVTILTLITIFALGG